MLGRTPAQTTIYLEAYPSMAKDINTYAKELEALGFVIASAWHKRQWTKSYRSADGESACFLQEPSLHSELLKINQADMMIVWPGGTSNKTWIKVGYAAACGLRILCVGGQGLVEDVQKFFLLRVDTWEDLQRNEFLKLGTLRYKRPRL